MLDADVKRDSGNHTQTTEFETTTTDTDSDDEFEQMRYVIQGSIFWKKSETLPKPKFKMEKLCQSYHKVASSKPDLLFKFGTFWPKVTVNKDQISPS